MPRYSAAQLTSTKILAQRSAVPAVFSRTITTAGKRKHGLSREEKDRLMRIAKRPRKGPFNSIMDPSEYAAGSGTVALSAAVKNSGKYDPWISQPVKEVKDGLETVQEKQIRVSFFKFLISNVLLDFSCPCQPPVLFQPRDLINVPAIVEPHQGTSYNPPVDAHQELLLKAAAVEEKRLKGVEKLAAVKAKMDSALRETDGLNNLGAAGMTVTAQIDSENAREEEREEGEEGDGQGSSLPRNFANRKTKAQKNKAARNLAEVCPFFSTFLSHGYSFMSGFL
jgi:nucleolar protein 53